MAQRYATVLEVRGLLGAAFDAPAVSDAEIQGVLDDQVCFLGLSAWGQCASVGSKYAAAHVVALKHPEIAGGGQSGLESGNSNGPASRTWAVSPASSSDSWWSSTCHGAQYLVYRKPVRGIGTIVMGVTSRTARPF